MKNAFVFVLAVAVVVAVSFADAQHGKELVKTSLIAYLHIADPKNFENIHWWSHCRSLCQNYVKFCFTKWMDPGNLFYPHCEDHMSYSKPTAQCQGCLRENGYPSLEPVTTTEPTTTTQQILTAPVGTNTPPAEIVCKCRRVQTLKTVTVAMVCSVLANQEGACDLSDPNARVSTSDESHCTCGPRNGTANAINQGVGVKATTEELYDYNVYDYHAK